MADSFSKKENNKKKAKKMQDKALRREDRKSNNNKGKTLDEMIVYVDVNGNFTSVPPHLQDKEADLAKAKREAANTGGDENGNYTGIVTYVSEKGFGFITEDKTRENVFFHKDQSGTSISKNDKVSYKKEHTAKGYRAVEITK